MSTKKKNTKPANESKSEQKGIAAPFSIRAIYIKNSEMKMSDSFDPIVSNQPLHAFNKVHAGNAAIREISHISENGVESKSKSAIFGISFSFGYRNQEFFDESSDSSKDFLVFISAEIIADYSINTDAAPSNEQLTQWGQRNVILHCWPYWREFCSNAQLRMGLPVTMVPLITTTT